MYRVLNIYEISVFCAGLLVGSFLNMLIDRLPRGEQIIKGRSHCDNCNHPLSWKDLIPVISWLILQGRCRYCKKKISSRNTIVELVTGILYLYGYERIFSDFSFSYILLAQIIVVFSIISLLIAIFFIDAKYYIIPDVLTYSLLVLAFFYLLTFPFPVSFTRHLISSIAAGAFFFLLFLFTKGKGMGLGDVKFALVMGIMLGYPGTVFALYLAFLTGSVVSVMLILTKKKRFGQVVAFGPFLVLGTLIVLFHLVPEQMYLFLP